jgi:quaternary ammonium compound-resistance protein SugE
MAWIMLVTAGIFEMLMALSLDRSQGFTRLGPSLLFLLTAVASFYLLSLALRELPVGTAYAVWTGIGAAGTAIIGIVLLGEPRDFARLVSLTLIVAGVAGLRLAGGGH